MEDKKKKKQDEKKKKEAAQKKVRENSLYWSLCAVTESWLHSPGCPVVFLLTSYQ